MKNKRSLLKYRGTVCLNCEQPLDVSEKYCHNCGQLNTTKKLTFHDFFYEYFAGIFAYDSRIYQTLRVLLFHPGKISRDYVAGKRERYANPYKFYLSVSIIFFILYGFSSGFEVNSKIAAPETQAITTADTLAASQDSGDDDIEQLLFPEFSANSLDEIYVSAEVLDTMPFLEALKSKWKVFSYQYHQKKITHPAEALKDLNYPVTAYNKWLYKKTVDFNFFYANPELFINYFIGKLPFIIFFFLPVFALFIWLLYVRKPFSYMEHLIFTFHAQSVFFVLCAIGLILGYCFGTDAFTTPILIIFLIYLFLALRKFYHQGRIKTFIKFILLNMIFLILAVAAFIIAFFASFAIY